MTARAGNNGPVPSPGARPAPPQGAKQGAAGPRALAAGSAAERQGAKAQGAKTKRMPDMLATVRARYEWYRDGWKESRRAMTIMAGTVAASLALNVYLATREREVLYFPTGPGCTLQAMTPLNQPVVSDADVYEYASHAVTNFFSFDYVNRVGQWEESRPLFTRPGWEGWLQAVESSGIREMVDARRLVVSAVPTGAPVMVEEKVQGEYYTWKVEIPILVRYTSASTVQDQPLLAELMLVRRHVYEDPRGKGLAVHRMITEPRSAR